MRVNLIELPSLSIPFHSQLTTCSLYHSDTKAYFRGDWDSQEALDTFLGDYSNSCVNLGCEIDSTDGLCLCPVTVQTEYAFESDADLISIQNVMEAAPLGAFAPDVGGEAVSSIADSIMKYPAGPINENTVFEFTDEYGRLHRRKNAVSWALLGSSSQGLKLRNPGEFFWAD